MALVPSFRTEPLSVIPSFDLAASVSARRVFCPVGRVGPLCRLADSDSRLTVSARLVCLGQPVSACNNRRCVWSSCGRLVVGSLFMRVVMSMHQNCQLSPPHCRLSYHAQQINHSLPITHALYVPVPGCSHPCTVSQETQQKHD